MNPRLRLALRLPAIIFFVLHGIEKIDWYFLLQKLIAFTIWILAFATINQRVDRPGSKHIDSVLAVAMAVAVLVVSTRALAAGAPAISRLTLAVDQYAYTVFPEVMRVPLIVHVPEELRSGFTVDTDTVAFTTDITPTLYKLLGHQPIDHEPLFGMTLIGPDAGALAKRRQRSYLVASSYGPVYGLLGGNGEALYIIDGVNTAEHHYDLQRGYNGEATIVHEAERANAARAIRDQVEEIATFYNVEPVAR